MVPFPMCVCNISPYHPQIKFSYYSFKKGASRRLCCRTTITTKPSWWIRPRHWCPSEGQSFLQWFLLRNVLGQNHLCFQTNKSQRFLGIILFWAIFSRNRCGETGICISWSSSDNSDMHPWLRPTDLGAGQEAAQRFLRWVDWNFVPKKCSIFWGSMLTQSHPPTLESINYNCAWRINTRWPFEFKLLARARLR